MFLSSPEATCEEGAGSCIDHLLAPVGFLNPVKYTAVTPAGFRPHLVSRISLSHRLRASTLAPHACAPAAIMPPNVYETVACIRPSVDAWEKAKNEACQSLGLPMAVWDELASLTPTQGLPLISLAFETHLMALRLFPVDPKTYKKSFGRGTPLSSVSARRSIPTVAT